MQLGILLGGLVLALFVFGRTKVKDPDPQAYANLADDLASPAAQYQRASALVARMLPGARDLTGGRAEKIVLDEAAKSRLYTAIRQSRRGFGIIVRTGPGPAGQRVFSSRAEYRAWWMQRYDTLTPKLTTYNKELATKLAPRVAAHLREYRGWYVGELVEEFQRAAGLQNGKGETSGRYGGVTMGALCYFLYEEKGKACDYQVVPSPLVDPMWHVPYLPPRSEQT